MSCWTLNMIGRWQKQGYLRTLQKHSCCQVQVSTANNYKFDLACNPRPAVLLRRRQKRHQVLASGPFNSGWNVMIGCQTFFFLPVFLSSPSRRLRQIHADQSTRRDQLDCIFCRAGWWKHFQFWNKIASKLQNEDIRVCPPLILGKHWKSHEWSPVPR